MPFFLKIWKLDVLNSNTLFDWIILIIVWNLFTIIFAKNTNSVIISLFLMSRANQVYLDLSSTTVKKKSYLYKTRAYPYVKHFYWLIFTSYKWQLVNFYPSGNYYKIFYIQHYLLQCVKILLTVWIEGCPTSYAKYL